MADALPSFRRTWVYSMNFTIHFRRSIMAAAALLLCFSGTSCKQVSQGMRSDPVTESDLIPPSPELRPVPQSQTPHYVPPPAPPTDAAQHEIPDDFWEQVDREVASWEDDEFFPDATPSVPPSFLRRRGEDSADRQTHAGRIAAARRDWERQHQLPIIVPATPHLTRVSREEPVLLPVPRER
jgi:hypothetical protein